MNTGLKSHQWLSKSKDHNLQQVLCKPSNQDMSQQHKLLKVISEIFGLLVLFTNDDQIFLDLKTDLAICYALFRP